MALPLASWALIATCSVAAVHTHATLLSGEIKTMDAKIEVIKTQYGILHAQTNALALTSLF